MKTLDKILIIMAIAIGIFTVAMVIIFCIYQAVPDSLITAFFSCFGAEGGFCAVITCIKNLKKDKDNEAIEEVDLQ